MTFRQRGTIAVTLSALLLSAGVYALATQTEKNPDYNMFGSDPSRNMINLVDKFPPTKLMEGLEPDPENPVDAKLKWKVELGSRAYGGPIISQGKVLVGTNNERPRNQRDVADGAPIDKGIVMCFEEATGKFLWQAVHDKLSAGIVHDWTHEGVCATPLVEGNRVYYTSNRCTVVCLDLNGMADGNQGMQDEQYKTETDADFIWEVDMIGDYKVFPHNMTAASPLLVGDILFIVTANGVDEGHLNIPAPQAPSFMALDKTTGKVLWTSNDPGTKIMHGQWSNPCYAEIKDVRQVIFPGGDGWLRAYVPETGELIWKCDCNHKDAKYELGGTGTRNDFIGTPVVDDGLVYIGLGQDPEHFSGVSNFWCIDPSKATEKGMDISPELGEWGKPGTPNPNSGIVWSFGGKAEGQFAPRDFVFGRTMSSASVIDGVVYIAELQGFIHCLDAKTGKKFWQYDTKGAIWGSTYYVDGKVYLATEVGELFCFKHMKEPKVIDVLDIPDATDNRDFNKKRREKVKELEAEYLLGMTEFPVAIRSTPVVVNSVMYVMTESELYAIEKK